MLTAYFDDGTPEGIGVVYNTTGDPTMEDNVYNGFEHMDELQMVENADGSRTVAFTINNLQPGTTYYLRGYMHWAPSEGGQTLYHGSATVTLPGE